MPRKVRTMIKRMLFAVLFILCIAQLNSGYEDSWPQLGHDVEHTFFSGEEIPKYLEIAWHYQLEPESGEGFRECFCTLTSPAVAEDRVYLLDFDHLYCLDLQTGELLFESPACSLYPYTPAVADGRVFLAAECDLFRCLDARTGEILWEKVLSDLYMTSPLIADNTVYVTAGHSPMFHRDISPCNWTATEWSTLVALNAETGEEIWHYSLGGSGPVMRGVGFPVLADGTILFYANYYRNEESYDADSEKSGIICLDAHTGVLKWKCEGVLPSSSSEPGGLAPFCMSYYNRKVYLGTMEHMVCFDVETQEPLWEFSVPGWAVLSVGNGVIVVCSWTRVECLDAETGKVLWEIPLAIQEQGFPAFPAMTDEEVIVGLGETLSRMDIKTGRVTGLYQLGSSVFSPVVADGHVLVGTSENALYCLGPSSYLTELTAITVGVLIVALVLLKRIKRI